MSSVKVNLSVIDPDAHLVENSRLNFSRGQIK